MVARKAQSAGRSAPATSQPVAAALARSTPAGLVLPRERLHALIDARLPGAVWLHGPTGAGKTVLLRSYLQRSLGASIWLSVDERHRDPAALFAAMSSVAEPHCAARLPEFSPEHRDDPGAFGHDYFARLDQLLASDVAIVVDDLHHLVGSTAPLLAAAIDRFGGRRRLCFASQLMPDASFAPQLAGSRLWIVGHKALAFDVDEARDLAGRIGTSATTLDALVDATDGWAAGLMLAMQFGASGGSDGGSNDPLETVRTPLAMLIAGQVLGGVPSEDVARLRLLAELPQVPMGLADLAPGWASACARLQGLAERGLFVERLAMDRSRAIDPDPSTNDSKVTRLQKGCWRLHDLLRGALRDAGPLGALEVSLGSTLVDELLGVDRLDLAWQLAVRLGPASLGRLVDSHGSEALGGSQRLSLLQLAQPFADRATPSIAVWCARAHIGNDHDAALAACEEAWLGAEASRAPDLAALSSALALFVIFATIESVSLAAAWAERLACFDHAAVGRIGRRDERALRLAGEVVRDLLIGGRSDVPHDDVQDRLMAEVIAEALSANETVLAGSLLVAAMRRSIRFQAVDLAIVRVQGLPSYRRAAPHIRASWNIENGFHFTRLGAARRAHDCFDGALALAEENALLQPRIAALIGLTRLELGLSDTPRALVHLGQLEALSPDRLGRQGGWVVHLRSRVDAVTGRHGHALRRIEQAAVLISDAGFPESTQVILDQDRIQILYATGAVAESFELARRVIERGSSSDGRRIEIVVGLLRAHALWYDDRERARALLRTHLASARELQQMTFCSLLPEVASDIAAFGLQEDIESDFLQRVVRLRGLRAPEPSPERWPWPVRIEVLRPFRILLDGERLDFQGKAQQKPLELLKYLACSRDFVADSQVLAAALWPDGEEASAKKSLEVTVSRLRKLLNDDTLVTVREGRVSLDRRRVSSDARDLLEATLVAEGVGSGHCKADRAVDLGDRLLKLFHELPLEHEDSTAWREATRERYRTAFVRATRALIHFWMRAGEPRRALTLIEAALGREPLAENLYQLCIQIHLDAGDHTEAMRVYRQCRQMLSVLIGAKPDAETERLRTMIEL